MTAFRAGPDPLAPQGAPVRVRFADGAFLTEADFQAEQLYHRGRLARALAFLHGAGTIAGLEVTIEPAGGDQAEIKVAPGLALDRLGRLIELPVEQCLRIGPWLADQAGDPVQAALLRAAFREAEGGLGAHVVADVFIAFHACARSPAPAFARGLQDHLDAVQPSRILDAAALDLVLRPAGVAPDEKLPHQTLPDLAALPAGERRAALDRFKRQELWPLLHLAPGTSPQHLPWPEADAAHEYVHGMEGSEILLARLRLPVTRADPLATPTFDPGQVTGAAHVRNEVRRHSYGAAELALLLQLATA